METRDKITNHFLPHLWGKWSGRTEGGAFTSQTPLPRFAVLSPQGGQGARSGFTLIELLVVVLIIGVLAAIALPQYQKAVWRSRATEVKVFAKNLADAQSVYRLDHGEYAQDFLEMDIKL